MDDRGSSWPEGRYKFFVPIYAMFFLCLVFGKSLSCFPDDKRGFREFADFAFEGGILPRHFQIQNGGIPLSEDVQKAFFRAYLLPKLKGYRLKACDVADISTGYEATIEIQGVADVLRISGFKVPFGSGVELSALLTAIWKFDEPRHIPSLKADDQLKCVLTGIARDELALKRVGIDGMANDSSSIVSWEKLHSEYSRKLADRGPRQRSPL